MCAVGVLQVWIGNIPTDIDVEGLVCVLSEYGVKPYRVKMGIRGHQATGLDS